MAVYRRGFQRYRGLIKGRWTRFLVLPRFAWRRLFQQRLVVLLMVIALIWPLLCAAFIYLSNSADLLQGLSRQFLEFIKVDGKFFLIFMNVQSAFTIFLAALAGPGLIAPDLTNNALPLYFSRPLVRTEYALARLTTLFGMLAIITWIPGLLLFAMQVGMAEASWFRSNWKLSLAIFAGFAVWNLLLSLVALTSSAYARIRVVAGGIVLGFYFLLDGAAAMINGVFRATWGHAVSPGWTNTRLWHAMLGTDPPSGPGVSGCLFVLLVMMLLLVLVLERKLRPVEIIK